MKLAKEWQTTSGIIPEGVGDAVELFFHRFGSLDPGDQDPKTLL